MYTVHRLVNVWKQMHGNVYDNIGGSQAITGRGVSLTSRLGGLGKSLGQHYLVGRLSLPD